MDLIDTLKWRYATKRMTDTKVAQDKIDEITEAIHLTASSAGLQPYKVFVVENAEVKQKLQAASFNPQVGESSHLLVFAAYDKINKQHIEDHINLTAEVRGVAPETMDAFKASLEGHLLGRSDEDNFTWASKQAYIALGTGIIAAANAKVDATPMEGFNPAEFDEILGLKEHGVKSVVLLALGYRDEANDYLAKLKKVRMPKAQFAVEVA